MNNPLRLIIDAVLVVAVIVLFYLHFSSKPAVAPAAATPAAVVQPAAKDDDDTTATAATTTVVPVADTDKVAYVESGKLLEGYKGMQDARRSFEAKARGWERQNQALVTSFQSAVQQYQKQAESLTPEQRAATEQKLQTQQQQAGMAQEKLQRQAQQEEAKMTEQVLGRINKQIEKYGKDNGYKLILIAAPSGTIAYGRKDIDITDQVLKHLNQEYAGKK
ncbi:OmpH family outer membrane protein [Hymenobacter cellulosilyticus]|uniref:OmpH family outer membrane protein n=1 Tax=Hymenobacter cellulosilyticus TaxID=2932248 RepID=A0A8T9QCW3_9BACT|nr:OmpH family outer membrane protein [Hymenobacter cellulosilyticus]UOQ74231.1 OmpH family outer membrane protein [Hymenobacter cellulosilyticus]